MILPFEVMEYQDRINQVKERMLAKGIEILLVTDPANMNYLTGYNGWSFYVHQLVVLVVDEEVPIWIGREQDANGARLTTWLSESHIISYPDDYVQSPERHPMDFVSDVLHEMGQSNRSIGVEMDSYYFTAKCYSTLRKRLQKAVFHDATSLVNWVRIIKSPQELEYMKRAASIVEKAMSAGIHAIQEGVRECDAVAAIYQSQISGTPDYGGDYPAIVPLLPSGKKTSTPHLTWTDQTYQKGEPIILELGGCYKRYHCPMARTVFLGTPPPKIVELSEVVAEGLQATLQAIQPGMTCEQVEKVWRHSIERRGYIKESRIGYSMGLNYPPDWGEHTASLRPGDQTILQPNMTFHLIPGIWLNDCGVEISESFYVTENGCQTFTNYPWKLFVKSGYDDRWDGDLCIPS